MPLQISLDGQPQTSPSFSPKKLYVFGDQTYDIQPRDLRELLHRRDNPVVTEFLERAHTAIRAQIHLLTPEQQKQGQFLKFSCVTDLALWRSSARGRCLPLDMAIMCLYQLGTFMRQVGHSYPSSDDSCILGICTGALAAAAVSCCGSTLELIEPGIQVVMAAFRIGMVVQEMAIRLTGCANKDEEPQQWSVLLSDPEAEELVLKFCHDNAQQVSPTSKPWISAYTPNAITVSGPPSSISQLLTSEACCTLRARKLPIYAPYHAPHLFHRSHVSEVLERFENEDTDKDLFVKVPILSASTGDMVEKGTFRTRLEMAVEQLLMQPIRWSLVLDRLRGGRTCTSNDLKVISMATVADQLISTALKLQQPTNGNKHQRNKSIEDQVLDSTSRWDSDCKIAIVGAAGRFPGGADGMDGLWDILCVGLDNVCKEVPATRWDVSSHCDATRKRKNTSATPFGCWLENPGLFDAGFFGVSGDEARKMDPQQRLSLLTTYEAIEQAGLVPGATPSSRPDRIGVMYGVATSDWRECNAAQDIDRHVIAGGKTAFVSGRISAAFGFGGPSYVVDTACSSSLAAIHLACKTLCNHDADTCIAGGVNLMTNPDMHAALDRCGVLSPTGNCKPFDNEADGYCRGEGVGSLVLKRLDDALAENDSILGVISSSYTSHGPENRRHALIKVLGNAGADAYSVGYVEMNSAGKPADDTAEVTEVLDVLAPPKSYRPLPLHLGSIKGCIGHGEAASGVSSVIKALLMMRKNCIPPHFGITSRINVNFPRDVDKRNVKIATKAAVPWPRRSAEPRRIIVNNFSMAGGNTTLLLEDAPLGIEDKLRDYLHSDTEDTRTHHIVTVSARSYTALRRNLQALRIWLQKNEDVSVAQLSYTTTARRMHHPYRAMLIGSTVHHLLTQIEDVGLVDSQPPDTPPAVVFVFTGFGQDSSFPDLFHYGRELMTHFSRFRREIRHLDQLVACLGLPSIIPFLRDRHDGNHSPGHKEAETLTTHLVSVCVQMALVKLWQSWNVMPSAVVSQSGGGGNVSGEYAALNAAGVLSDADTITLVAARARLSASESRRHGHVQGQQRDMAAGFSQMASSTICHMPRVPVFLIEASGNVTGPSRLLDSAYLVRNLGRLEANKAMAKGDIVRICQDHNMTSGRNVLLEISPLASILGRDSRPLSLTNGTSAPNGHSRHDDALWDSLTRTLQYLYCAGTNMHWHQYHGDFKASNKVMTNLPAYSWDLDEYWIRYVNDWTLRKGDPPLVVSARKLETTTIHNVLEETETPERDKVTMVVEADICDEQLYGCVQGHVVDGIPLCTPTVYTDIALSVGEYLLQRYRPANAEKQIVISDMAVTKALIPQPIGPHILQAQIEVDWNTNSAACKFDTFSKGNPQQHAQCVILFTDTALQEQLRQFNAGMTYRNLVNRLRQDVAAEKTNRFTRNMMYRMISSLAVFHPDHKLVDDIVLDSETNEATARVSFDTLTTRDKPFHTHPAVLDALTQPGGFSLNGADGTDLDHEVYINHGWKALHLFDRLHLDKSYTVYTRMTKSPDEERIWTGPIVVLDGDNDTIVALFESYSIQCLPRRTLRVLLNAEGGSAYKAQVQNHGHRQTNGVNRNRKPPPPPPVRLTTQTPPRPVPTSLRTPRLQIPETTSVVSWDSAPNSYTVIDSMSSSINGFASSPDTTYSDRPWFSSTHAHAPTTANVPQASSIILQGTIAKASKLLFLFPDGSGSAASYASIPPIGSDTAVIGLNCPFLKNSTAMHTIPLDSLMDQGYLSEIRRRQPHGPYYLGGWSAGGTLAYRAAQMLLQSGEGIASIIMIDAPPPLRGMDPLPQHFYDYCERKGAFGGWSGMGKQKTPEWLIPHFNGTIKVLQYYRAEPLSPALCQPRADERKMTLGCIWATDSVVDPPGALPPHPDDTEGMKFLTVRRTDFSGAGWDTLFPVATGHVKLVCDRINGAHHFSLTRQPYVSKLADFIRRVM